MSICAHMDTVRFDVQPSADGCEECLATGGQWLQLRMCQQCGHIGCCDSSPGRHSSAHARTGGHEVARSFEPGEEWFYCFADEVTFEMAAAPPSQSHS